MPIFAHLVGLSVPLWGIIEGVYTPAECDAFVARIEAGKPTPAPITGARGTRLEPESRNNTRVMFDDPVAAAALFTRVRPHVPAKAKGMHLVGANELLRCYRYEAGQRFAPHLDGSYARTAEERSLYTLMLYLTEGFEGGETVLHDIGERITPRRGLVLYFQHAILHEGAIVRAGVKYAVRSDLMYRAIER